MNTFQIKWIAIITMLIDHIGFFFFPQFIWFRLIGRLSFPLFAWLIANGASYTHDIKKYMLRLYFFALLSQIPFLLANRLLDSNFSGLNVLCTLFFGLVAIYVIQRTVDKKLWLLMTLVCIAVAQLLQTDYGGFGVAVIVVFYLFFTNFRYLIAAQTVLFLAVFFLLPTYLSGLLEPLGLFSLVFIYLYNNKPGLQATYLFYIIYPLQYVIFYFLLMRLLPFIV